MAVYLWQMPFQHHFTGGTGLTAEMVPLMIFCLFVWSGVYTEYIEKPAVQLIRFVCGKCVPVPSAAPRVNELLTEPLAEGEGEGAAKSSSV